MTGAQLTVADISPGATDKSVGAVSAATQPGPLMPVMFTLAGAEQGLVSPPTVSSTWHVMVWLGRFVIPVTRSGLDEPVTVGSAPLADDVHVAMNVAPA